MNDLERGKQHQQNSRAPALNLGNYLLGVCGRASLAGVPGLPPASDVEGWVKRWRRRVPCPDPWAAWFNIFVKTKIYVSLSLSLSISLPPSNIYIYVYAHVLRF